MTTPRDRAQELVDTRSCDDIVFSVAKDFLAIEAELSEQLRLNGMGSEREARLMARVDELEARCKAMEAVVEAAREVFENDSYHSGLGEALNALDALDALKVSQSGTTPTI
jgi:hypothetical protein